MRPALRCVMQTVRLRPFAIPGIDSALTGAPHSPKRLADTSELDTNATITLTGMRSHASLFEFLGVTDHFVTLLP